MDRRNITNRSNCPLCKAGKPGRHPDKGGTHPARLPARVEVRSSDTYEVQR